MSSEQAIQQIKYIQLWADKNPWFKTDFLDSCKGFYGRKGYLSEKQRDAIRGIYFNPKMGIDQWVHRRRKQNQGLSDSEEEEE